MINLIKPVYAASPIAVDIGAEATKNDFFGFTCIGNLVSNIVAAGFLVSGIIVFLYIVWGGFDYLSSGGDKTKIESAQKKISSAIIGLAIVASSWAIYQLVLYFFGINLDSLCTDNPIGN